MRARGGAGGLLAWMLALFCVAGLVHLVSVLILPRLAPNDAFARLAGHATAGRLVILSADAAELGPFHDPALAEALCFYDLARAPLRLRESVDGEHLLTLSFHARYGAVFYAMTDKAALRGRIDVLVVSADQKAALDAEEEDEPSQDLRLVSPTSTGFVLMSTLVDRPDGRADAEARLAAIGCNEEKQPVESGVDD